MEQGQPQLRLTGKLFISVACNSGLSILGEDDLDIDTQCFFDLRCEAKVESHVDDHIMN